MIAVADAVGVRTGVGDRTRLPVGTGPPRRAAPDARDHRNRRQDDHDAAHRRHAARRGAAHDRRRKHLDATGRCDRHGPRRLRRRVHQLPSRMDADVPRRGRRVAEPGAGSPQLAPLDGHLRSRQGPTVGQSTTAGHCRRLHRRSRGDAPAAGRPGPIGDLRCHRCRLPGRRRPTGRTRWRHRRHLGDEAESSARSDQCVGRFGARARDGAR